LLLFDDLLEINPQGLTRLFQEVPEVKWVIALRGQAAEFVDSLLKPLASRRAELIRATLVQMGPQSVSKVEAAQREILVKALQLEERGLLVFAKDEDPLV
jgi:flagellar motor switch protein FliG